MLLEQTPWFLHGFGAQLSTTECNVAGVFTSVAVATGVGSGAPLPKAPSTLLPQQYKSPASSAHMWCAPTAYAVHAGVPPLLTICGTFTFVSAVSSKLYWFEPQQ